MGVRLIVEALDHAPADLISEELLVLLILCEDANDITREGWPGMPLLVRRSRKAASTVRRLLTGLESKKAITRLAAPSAGQPAAGQVVAHRGHRTVYRINHMSEMSDTEVLTHEHLPPEKGARPRAERRSPMSRKALTGEHPPLMSPSGPLTGPVPIDAAAVAAVRAGLLARTGHAVDESWATRVAAQLLAGRSNIAHPARWLAACLETEPNPARLLPTPGPPRIMAP